ncbi:hypothetical protein JG688_00018111 [Phytophthora aleatoria]|uniref:Uncharacterized protein n=1 Tax=Phytophthora aleatoria TaxID=2496075 RepID=A0A8J5ICM1_9STRA|nr:hypothetical protein JG688_00018111 [Phytophthora aleatoria]
MTDQYKFLEVWRTSLLGSIVHGHLISALSPLQVSFDFLPNAHHDTYISKTLSVRLPLDKESRRGTKQLQRLQSADAGGGRPIYPNWVWLCGKLAPTDPGAVRSPVSWGILLGFQDDPWVNSPEFREAAQKLKNMALGEQFRGDQPGFR